MADFLTEPLVSVALQHIASLKTASTHITQGDVARNSRWGCSRCGRRRALTLCRSLLMRNFGVLFVESASLYKGS